MVTKQVIKKKINPLMNKLNVGVMEA